MRVHITSPAPQTRGAHRIIEHRLRSIVEMMNQWNRTNRND